MNFLELYETVGKWIAAKLDKLKVKKPIYFTITQSAWGVLLGLFANDNLNLPDWNFLLGISEMLSTDAIVIGLLTATIAALGPRTSGVLKGEFTVSGKKIESNGTA